MKFMHVADLHVDQPFANITTEDTVFQKKIQKVNHRVLTNIIDACIEQSVDFLLIVGDTFHQAKSSIVTQQLILEQFKRLEEHDIAVVMSFGNHDYYDANRYWFEWPKNVLLYDSDTVETKILSLNNGETIAISGFSYTNQWINHSKASEYPMRKMDADYHIGFYHGEIGAKGNYAPFLLSDLNSSYDYWALGHIHKSEQLSENPLIVYPGTPQGHSKKEHYARGICLVELVNSTKEVTWIDVSEARFKRIEVPVTHFDSRGQYLSYIEEAILSDIDTQALLLVDVSLRPDTGELMSDLLEYHSELLDYLQRKLLTLSNQNIWVMNVDVRPVDTDKLIMGFEDTLIDDLALKYHSDGVFDRLAKDVMQQSSIAANITLDTSDKKHLIESSVQLLKDKMIFKNEDSQ